MSFLRWIAATLLLLALLVAGLFFYFIHAPLVPEPPLDGQYQRFSLSTKNGDRQFSVYRPNQLPDDVPLVFVLHGSKGSGKQIRAASAYEFDTLADKYGFIVVYPDGFQGHWNDCRASADYTANTQSIDDIAFFKEVLASLQQSENTNPKRVFAVGHSNGGHMAYRLALEAPELVNAIAAISANLPDENNLDCQPSGQPVSVAIFNGDRDPINPYEGGLVTILGNSSRGEVRSAITTARYWAKLLNGSQQPITIQHPERDGNDKTTVTEQRWLGNDDSEVRLYTLHGSGHVIPSTIAQFPLILGGDASDLSGPAEIVAFFMYR